MNILILVNNGPGYVSFFKEIGKKFEEDGCKAYYAIDSKVAEIRHNDIITGDKFYFTNYKKQVSFDYIRKNYESDIRKTYFATFDRNIRFNFANGFHKEMDTIIARLIYFFENILEEYEIDLVLFENVSNVFSYIAYLVARKMGIDFDGLIMSRVPNRYEIWEDQYGNLEKRSELFEQCILEEIKNSEQYEFIIRYIENISNTKPDYMKQNPTNQNVNYTVHYLKRIKKIMYLFKYITMYRDDMYQSYESYNPLDFAYRLIKRSFMRKFRIKLLGGKFDPVDYNEDFYIFPLHYQPESSTCVNAMYFVDQYEVIKNIVFTLPIGTVLYVKEHPNAIGFQLMQFYKNLKNLPNVKYIGPNTDLKSLISNSKGVITLTSTMGYEALLMKKPVITLGKVFYNYHPYCFNVNTFEQIPEILEKCKNINEDNFINYNIRFIYTYLNDTFEGHLNLCDYKKSDPGKVAQDIIKHYNYKLGQ